MSSRTVKWLLLASVLLITLPVVAGASTSRVAGLGVQGDYIKDYSAVYTYVSEVSCVGNVVYGELGNWDGYYTSDRAMGAILGNLFDGKYGTIAIRLNEETAQLGQGDANTPVAAGYAWDPNVNTSHSFDLLWGKKFGKMSLGLELNRSYAHTVGDPYFADYLFENSYSWNDVEGDNFSPYYPEDLNWHRNILGFGGGLGYEVSPKLTLEGSVLFQSRTFTAKDTLFDNTTFAYTVDGGGNVSSVTPGQSWENDGSSAYLMAVRGLYQAKPDLLLVPMFKYYSFTADAKGTYILPEGIGTHTGVGPDLQYDTYPAGSDSLFGGVSMSITDEDHRSGWQLGLAGNWTLNQNDLFVLGATVASNQRTVKSMDFTVTGTIPRTTSPVTESYVYSDPFVDFSGKLTENLMPTVFAALETHVNSWLTLRFGASQGVFYSVKTEVEYFQYNYLTDKVEAVPGSKNVTTYHYSPFSMSLGAGFKFGLLQLDATVNSDFIHRGPYFISGAPTGYTGGEGSYYNALFPRVTATYTF